MYAMQTLGYEPLRMNAALREYARLEYRVDDARWILASARLPRKAPRAHGLPRLFERRARPTPRPVACKGSPRRSSDGAPSTG